MLPVNLTTSDSTTSASIVWDRTELHNVAHEGAANFVQGNITLLYVLMLMMQDIGPHNESQNVPQSNYRREPYTREPNLSPPTEVE